MADTDDREPVPVHLEEMVGRHLASQFRQLFTLKLGQLATTLAIEMVMLRVPIVQFVDRFAADRKFPNQSRFQQLVQRPVDGRSADAIRLVSIGDQLDQFIGFKMLVPFVDAFEHRLSLLGEPFTTAVQELPKSLDWCQRYFDRPQRIIFGLRQFGNLNGIEVASDAQANGGEAYTPSPRLVPTSRRSCSIVGTQ